tara:strand:- start:193 stop:717 length:525 start_codon:yes stop_codon:yes gene_type:complete
MMVDRPFFRGARLNSTTPVVDVVNPNFSNLVQLVRVGDLPSEDGAIIEDLFVTSKEAYPDDSGTRAASFGVYVYAPNQSAPSTAVPLQIAAFTVGLSGSTFGLIQRIELPKVIAPTPNVGYVNQTRPIEIGGSEALYLEKGYILCVGQIPAPGVAVSGGMSASGVDIFAQGGFY